MCLPKPGTWGCSLTLSVRRQASGHLCTPRGWNPHSQIYFGGRSWSYQHCRERSPRAEGHSESSQALSATLPCRVRNPQGPGIQCEQSPTLRTCTAAGSATWDLSLLHSLPCPAPCHGPQPPRRKTRLPGRAPLGPGPSGHLNSRVHLPSSSHSRTPQPLAKPISCTSQSLGTLTSSIPWRQLGPGSSPPGVPTQPTP